MGQRRVREWRGESERVEVAWLVGFGTELRSLARDGLETCFNAGHRASRMTRLALKEVQPSVLLQDGLWRATRVTGHVFLCKIKMKNKRVLDSTYINSKGFAQNTLPIRPGI